MSASHEHRRLSSVRACVLLLMVWLGVCALLFGDEPRRGLTGLSDSLSPVHDAHERAQRIQRTQRSNDDRVQDFYESVRTTQVQQKREEDRKARDAQRLAARRFSHAGHRYRR